MIRAVFFICLTSCVNSETSSFQHSVYLSRKSRSNEVPLESGYVYKKVDHHPGIIEMFGNDATDYSTYKSGGSNDVTSYDSTLHSNKYLDSKASSYTSSPISKYDYEYEKSKAEIQFDSHYLPSKMKSDAMYEKLKSLMHYKYPESSPMSDMGYDTYRDYHVDDDDVRSSSRSYYDSWPYFYHNPYEFEDIKYDSDMEKAKDKRFISGKNKDIIPVHEEVDDIPNSYNTPMFTNKYNREVSTDNPIYGNQPFFSFVLNDYFDKNAADDHLTFKGLDWGKEFDHGSVTPGPDSGVKRDRRLHNSYTPVDENYFSDKTTHSYDSFKGAVGESSTEKGYNKKHEFEKHEKGDNQKENHKSGYEQNGQNYRGFKDFVDTFANKFGGEENKKDAKYVLKKDQDKSEKRKGFRRVYHKDEYQEDNEFYDNTKNSAKAEEKGASSLHNGGSEAILQSHAAAATGNDANAYNKAGNAESNKFDNTHRGHNLNKGHDSEFNRYRDVAKSAARSNSVDY